jgi:hypothetical protein
MRVPLVVLAAGLLLTDRATAWAIRYPSGRVGSCGLDFAAFYTIATGEMALASTLLVGFTFDL